VGREKGVRKKYRENVRERKISGRTTLILPSKPEVFYKTGLT